MEQTRLFDEDTDEPHGATATAGRQLCPLCRIRPVRVTLNGTPKRYCGGSHCGNPTRLCHQCDQPYTVGTVGSGTKYCSPECKKAGYANTTTVAKVSCPICARLYKPPVGKRHTVCHSCVAGYAAQVSNHALDTTWVIRLVKATACDSCGEPLPHSNGKNIGEVDHDHACCPGKKSCGKCVRGIICHRCNVVAGSIESNRARYAAVLAYLGDTLTP